MKNYLKLASEILDTGTIKDDRTGTGTVSLFGKQLKFNLEEGFPLITTKKVHLPSVIHELIWLISGDTNIKYLRDNNVRIWNEWVDENDNLPFMYGHQWRKASRYEDNGGYMNIVGEDKPQWVMGKVTKIEVDQLQDVIDTLKTDPDSRRMIVNSWQITDIHKMPLPPCHMMFQFYVNDGKLSCLLHLRSSDVFLGLPFNIASYALLTHMVANVCDLGIGELVINTGDVHIYKDHSEAVRTQLQREPLALPKLKFAKEKYASIDDFKYEDIIISDYESHPAIKGKVSV